MKGIIMEYYKDRSFGTLQDELWIDAPEFNGIYEVSNFGRVKSLGRLVLNKWGGENWRDGRILKQTVRTYKNKVEPTLQIGLQDRKTRNLARFIFSCFYPDIDFKKDECLMHINKVFTDNRIVNLRKVTRKTSKGVDMIKSPRTLIAVHENIKKATEANILFYNERTHKTCSECGKIDLVKNFPDGKSVCQPCINLYVNKRRENFVQSDKPIVCNKCGIEKIPDDFPKLCNTCKLCCYTRHKKYQDEQRKNLGNWYVKEYGKYSYGIKIFTPEIITELRNEIIESRKPKYFLDNKIFYTGRGLAKHINNKYNIPLTTIFYRLSRGNTEIECTMTRKEFIKHNKTKL